mmetsp:Transcript_90884/g.166824  ORF Transcript_90884/g.166824 Transcript_90884/m.166824 type:complete len:274 (+) Transcript_90884:123-944(+)
MGTPVTFEQTSDIESARNGHLECNCCRIVELQKHTIRHNCNIGAVAESSIDAEEDASFTGITFDLASCGSGFSQMVLGLTNSNDGSESVDFGVKVHVNELFLTTISMTEYGRKTYTLSCEGDENVTIRLDGAGEYVQFLVNDGLVYTSSRPAKFPLLCKAVNIIKGNIPPKFHLRPQDKWPMRLPIKNLQWSKAVFKVVTLRVDDYGMDGNMTTACMNLAGDELARLETPASVCISDFKELLARQITCNPEQLRLLHEDGKLAADTDVLTRAA